MYLPFVKRNILEAVNADIKLIVCITEEVPTLDMLEVKQIIDDKDIFNWALIVLVLSLGIGKMGIMPADIHMPGRVGVISRSGTPNLEGMKQTSDFG